MAFSQDNRGYQEINQTNKFDKQRTDPIPGMLLSGEGVSPEKARDVYFRSEKFKHLPLLQQEYLKNLPEQIVNP